MKFKFNLSARSRMVLFAAYVAFSALYLVWRIGFTMNWYYPVYSLIFLAAEIFCILSSLVFYTLVVRKNDRPRPGDPPAGLTVDVFIATYNEELHLLRRTAVAAREMDYSHRTFLCDDGRRPEVEALARELGIGYLTRPTNEHHKAGNLNNAFVQTQGDFILVLDADHVPRRHFLTRVLGYFADSEVALVQTPQVYYNIDSFQHYVSPQRRRFWHEAVIFHHLMQPGADRLNAAFFVGTGAVLRRSALAEIGGFATGSITEDIHTSMRLHAKGRRSVYVDEALGFMLAPDTPLAYTVQRLRWAQGAMQLLRKENPLTKPGLSFWQRISYLNSLSGYLAAYQHLLFYLAPGIYLFSGASPIAVDPHLGFPIFVVHIVFDLLVYQMLAAPHARIFLGECFKMLNFPVFLRASAALLKPEGLSFRVTPKGSHGGLPLQLLLPSAFLFIFNLTAVAIGFLRLQAGDSFGSAVVLTMFFAAEFAVAGAIALLHSYERERVSEAFAFPVSVASKIKLGDGTSIPASIRRLEAERAYILCGRTVAAGERLSLDFSGIGGSREIASEVMGSHPSPDPRHADQFILKLRPLDLPSQQRDIIDRYLFETALPAFLSHFEDGPNLGASVSGEEDLEPIQGFFHVRSEIV